MSEPGELQAAKAELQRKKNNLRTAIQRHDKLLESSSAESQEALKAELGVAKAKLGVAEAELGVAKEELGVAKEELGVVKAKEDTPEQQSEIVKAEMGVAKAEMGVAKAEWDVAIAVYDSEAKTSNPGRLEFLQGQINDRKETYNDSKQAYNDSKITYKRLEEPPAAEGKLGASQEEGGQQGSESFADPREERQAEAVKKAFDDAITYASITKYDEVFAKYIRSCALKFWKGSSRYFSPYVVLFQSSMTGKSRLLKEIAQKKFFTVMICVRKPSLVVQPPRTKAVADALFQGNITSSTDTMLVLLKSYLLQFQQWVDKSVKEESQITPKDWHSQQQEADTEVGRALIDASRTSNFNMNLPDWSAVLRKLREHPARASLDLLFVFDEARELLTKVDKNGIDLFRGLRKALRILQSEESPRIMAVLTDTLSTLANFAPSKGMDPSRRDTTGRGNKLFRPFFQVATFDLFAPREPVELWDLEILQNWERLISYGRPGWASLFRAGSMRTPNAYNSEQLITLAKEKLLGGLQVVQWPPEMPDMLKTFRIALLSRRALVRIGMRSEIAQNMVASCMGMCMRVSEDIDSMMVDSLSEPILSEAAARIINEFDLWPELLETLIDAMSYGAVETGRVGELASWILLAIGWDAACKAKQPVLCETYTRSDISLGDLLKALLGKVPELDPARPKKKMRTRQDSSTEQEDNSKAVLQEVMEMLLCITHATQLHTSGLSFENLKMAACRMLLAVCAPGTDAIDAFLALLPPKGKQMMLGVLQLQIKNKKVLRSAEAKRCLKNMGEVSRVKISPTDQECTQLRGVDALIHVGDQSGKESKCEIFVDEHTQRVCLLLSTDSKLSLFGSAFAAVTKTADGAQRLASAFEKLVDAERLASFKQKTWSVGNAQPCSPDLVSPPGEPTVEAQMDALTDIFFVEDRADNQE